MTQKRKEEICHVIRLSSFACGLRDQFWSGQMVLLPGTFPFITYAWLPLLATEDNSNYVSYPHGESFFQFDWGQWNWVNLDEKIRKSGTDSARSPSKSTGYLNYIKKKKVKTNLPNTCRGIPFLSLRIWKPTKKETEATGVDAVVLSSSIHLGLRGLRVVSERVINRVPSCFFTLIQNSW